MTAVNAPIEVAVGIIYNPHGEILFAQRPAGKPYAGWWEFPGGKLESGETIAAALGRELQEELGIQMSACRPWLSREHHYPHASVRLHFCKVHAFSGQVQGLEGQAFVWRPATDPGVTPILPAALPLLPWLGLPDVVRLGPVKQLPVVALPNDPQKTFTAAWAQSRAALDACAAQGADFVLLGPVQGDAAALGWAAVAQILPASPVPVYLYGGLAPKDLAQAQQLGAQGIAL